jgi:hypothetical protein
LGLAAKKRKKRKKRGPVRSAATDLAESRHPASYFASLAFFGGYPFL